jgi:RimJ/RimL family protein N-acetyltransferase
MLETGNREQRKPVLFFTMNEPGTKRLEFRLYSLEERDRFLRLVTDPDVMKFVGDGPLTREGAESLWNKLLGNFYPKGITSIWALFSRDSGSYIGHASLRPRPEFPEEWEIGYILRKEEWGKGYASEIASALISYGFAEMNLCEVFATVDEDHSVSIRVLTKSGMSFKRYDHDQQGRYSVFSIRSAAESASEGNITMSGNVTTQ